MFTERVGCPLVEAQTRARGRSSPTRASARRPASWPRRWSTAATSRTGSCASPGAVCCIGGALGYALPLKNIATINVEFYTDVDERLDVPVVLPPVLDLVDLENTKVLVVDDVADTGETLQLVLDLLRPSVAEVRSAVLYEKPRSIVHPDYVWRRTDAWINFPWSTEPPVGPVDTAG